MPKDVYKIVGYYYCVMGFRFPVLIVVSVALLLLSGCMGTAENTDPNTTDQLITDNATNNTIINNTIDTIQNNSENISTDLGKYDFSPVYNSENKLIIYFFHYPHCPACKSIAPKVEEIGYKYQNWTEWKGFNINIDQDRAIYFQFYDYFNLTPERSGTPMILVNNTILWGQYEINNSLEKIINGSINN